MIIEPSIWVFGYGSLTWKPNIKFTTKHIGFIWGFSRKFWQGNIHQRGTMEKPGRVLTLIDSEGEKCWGVAYEVCGQENIRDALSHLETREMKLGGYRKFHTKFYRRDAKIDEPNCDQHETLSSGGDGIDVLCFTATSNNPHYLGPCDIDIMAEQIVGTGGSCGPNSEYVLRLALFVRKNIPEDDDAFLFALDAKIKAKQKQEESIQIFSALIGQNLSETINASVKSAQIKT